jgi:hypothetical protein
MSDKRPKLTVSPDDIESFVSELQGIRNHRFSQKDGSRLDAANIWVGRLNLRVTVRGITRLTDRIGDVVLDYVCGSVDERKDDITARYPAGVASCS